MVCMFVYPTNSYVDILTPSVMVSGGEEVMRAGPHDGISVLKERLGRALSPFPLPGDEKVLALNQKEGSY